MRPALIALAALALTACASHTNEIPAAYVSPLQYQDYSCKQIGAELRRVSARAQQVAHDVDKNASGDSTAMAVGLVLFWPALFFIDGDTPQAQEYARLKGEFDALEQVAIQKDCGLKVERPFTQLEARKKEQSAQETNK
ncbi:MAG: hypothetical protein ABS36_08675 [Acidobacteria bacterium SCN 69-37]|nr:MAG: hypothetical protein ABS36_08675 [Acidobacteria bacterium SCN 69-37]